MFDPDAFKSPKSANLCSRCRYVTFNEPDEEGRVLCNVCEKKEPC